MNTYYKDLKKPTYLKGQTSLAFSEETLISQTEFDYFMSHEGKGLVWINYFQPINIESNSKSASKDG